MEKREIKFRAYHKKDNWMYNVFSFCNQFVKIIVGEGMVNKYPTNEFSELMQFTGLQDKNGLDIYEGDIFSKVKVSELGENIQYFYVVKWSSSDCGYRVFKYRLDENENGLYWKKQPSSDSLHMVIMYNHVIGNIHENPELLNPKP